MEAVAVVLWSTYETDCVSMHWWSSGFSNARDVFCDLWGYIWFTTIYLKSRFQTLTHQNSVPLVQVHWMYCYLAVQMRRKLARLRLSRHIRKLLDTFVFCISNNQQDIWPWIYSSNLDLVCEFLFIQMEQMIIVDFFFWNKWG